MRKTSFFALCVACLVCQQAPAADPPVFINQITTSASVQNDERTARPGAVLTRVNEDSDGGVSVDAYASLDDNNTAFQSYSGFNAVRVQAALANGYPQNIFRASTSYDLSVTTGPDYQALFLDYLVFPGVVGLPRFAAAGSKARISYSVDTAGPISNSTTGIQAEVLLERVLQGRNVVTRSTVDPIFAAAGVQTSGAAEIEGFLVDTIETQPFFDTVYLGFYSPVSVVDVRYQMEALIEIPGYETAAIARIGDPFALRADLQAEIDKHFPGSNVPFRIRAVPMSAVPEPSPGGFALAGLVVIAWRLVRRAALPRGSGAFAALG